MKILWNQIEIQILRFNFVSKGNKVEKFILAQTLCEFLELFTVII